MPSPITFKNKGDFSKTFKFMHNYLKGFWKARLSKYGEMGVEALREATPKRTGFTSESWYYEIEESTAGVSIVWKNSHIEKGWANIALLLQYGHATGNGGYVQGVDYINPALQPIFNEIAKSAWEEVTRD